MAKNGPKNTYNVGNKKKINQIHQQDLYFGSLPRQYINLGVSVHMGNIGVPKCAIYVITGKKKGSFIMIVLFLAFCALKSRFLSLPWGFNPLLRPKVP